MIKEIPNLIVGSVFVPHNSASFWYNTQIKYLKKTVGNFKHIVCINGNLDHKLFKESTIIKGCDYCCCDNKNGDFQSENHLEGLKKILKYFRSNLSKNYLILDNDCFPVMENWLNILKNNMGDFKFAAPFRFENLDYFPHPSAFFIRGEFINDPILDFTPKKRLSLTNNTMQDIGSGIPSQTCYPLIRSNVFNVHPVLCGVYNHMFYHHGCGSRNIHIRSVVNGYFDHYRKINFHEQCMKNLILEIQNNTEDFLKKIMWE